MVCCVSGGEGGEATFPEVWLLQEKDGLGGGRIRFEDVCLGSGTTSHVHLNQEAGSGSEGRPPGVGLSPSPCPCSGIDSIGDDLCCPVRSCADSRSGEAVDRLWGGIHCDVDVAVLRALAWGIF